MNLNTYTWVIHWPHMVHTPAAHEAIHMAIHMAISGHVYIQTRRAGSRRAPFLRSFLVHHTLVRQRGSKKWTKGTQNGPLKRRQHPELFWVAKRTPKGHQNGHPELTKAPNMAPSGADMRLKGTQICPTKSLKERRVFETAPGPVLCRQKGSKRGPKGTQNGDKTESKNAHIFKPFRALIWGKFAIQEVAENWSK